MPRRGVKLTKEADAKNRAANAAWKQAHIENLSIGLRIGKRDAYKRLAEARATSVSAMIQNYMDEEYRKEFGEDPPVKK